VGTQGRGTNHRNGMTLRRPTPIHGAVAQVAVAAVLVVPPLPAPVAGPVVLCLAARAEPDPALVANARSSLRGRLQR